MVAAAFMSNVGFAQQDEQTGYSDVASSVSPPVNFDINSFVGANTYYNAGINGQNTRTIVSEAGHIWNGNESLTHVTNFYSSSFSYGGTNMNSRLDRHATWVAGVLGGREVVGAPQIYQKGIAYGTTLGSSAIASTWAGAAYTLNFSWNYSSWTGAMYSTFANADVINQSFGFTDSSGTNVYTRMTDALITANSKVVNVVSAGNSGTAGSVGSPGSGYNSITVGGAGNANNYDSVASFSSRGPQNWGYITSGGSAIVISNVRAPVDIIAPASSIIAPFYGAQTGGNNPTLSGSTNLGTATNSYSSLNGTSFASPIVAGGASLVSSAARSLPGLSNNQEAIENTVIKALLLNGATKLAGWNNGQVTNSGVVTTTQAKDYSMGTGMLNLGATYTNQTQGQKGVSGLSQGNLGIVDAIGWDFGTQGLLGTNSYSLSGLFSSNTSFTGTLTWLRQRTMNTASASANGTDVAEADLNFAVWKMNSDGSQGSLIGASESTYNLVEHLSFLLPETGYYMIGVIYKTNNFNNTGTWGTGTNTQNYGLAWNGNSSPTIYYQSGNWTSNSSWNTLVDGSGITASNSAVTVNTTFGNGLEAQTPLSVTVDGNQYTKALTFQTGETSLTGTNSGNLFIGSGGLRVEASTTGQVSLTENLNVNLQGSQTWDNNSSEILSVAGTISGSGNLAISNSSTQAVTKLGKLGYSGSHRNLGKGVTEINGVISNNVTSVSQEGEGKLELNGINSYTGITTVTSGTLKVNGSISSSSLTTASNAGTLGGSGTVGNTLIAGGGTINPGNSTGLLSIEGNLTWDINGNYNWEIIDASGIAGTAYDTINVSGMLNLNLLSPTEKFNINLWTLSSTTPDQNGVASNFDPNQDYLWTIVSTDSGINGFDPSAFNINVSGINGTGGFANALNGSFSLTVANDDLILAYNTVPEPSTIALLAIVGTFFWLKAIKKRILK
jgi:autotransporter-associated beta strand protein